MVKIFIILQTNKQKQVKSIHTVQNNILINLFCNKFHSHLCQKLNANKLPYKVPILLSARRKLQPSSRRALTKTHGYRGVGVRFVGCTVQFRPPATENKHAVWVSESARVINAFRFCFCSGSVKTRLCLW